MQREVDDIASIREGPILHGLMGGDLVFVYVDFEPDDEDDEDDEDGLRDEFYVHVTNERVHVFELPIDVFRAIADYRPNLWHKLVGYGTVPGLIAILITFTICYLALVGQSDKIPQVLGAVLTTIVGFYFGSKATQR